MNETHITERIKHRKINDGKDDLLKIERLPYLSHSNS